jgi:hypothetical protein
VTVGKWTERTKDLPALEQEDRNWQHEINEAKTLMVRALTDANAGVAPSASMLAEMYKGKRLEKDALAEKEHQINTEIEALTQLIIDAYEEEGVDLLRLKSGGKVSTKVEPYAQVKDRAAYLTWVLKDPDLRQSLSLPWQTTNSLVKHKLEDEEEMPPGIGVFRKTSLVFHKS